MHRALILIIAINKFLISGDLKSPAEFLGYELGDYFTAHHKVVAYYEHVAKENSNVKTIFYGETYERRPLMTAIYLAI